MYKSLDDLPIAHRSFAWVLELESINNKQPNHRHAAQPDAMPYPLVHPIDRSVKLP
jgi:hypothetical protein